MQKYRELSSGQQLIQPIQTSRTDIVCSDRIIND